MEVKVSSKHQVVIPKAARKKLQLPKSGAYMVVKNVTPTEITFAKVAAPTPKGDIMQYAGIAKGAWGKNPVATLRKMRDEEWD
jgi:AbrB family looped-hinge helix DNA binding protein